MELPDGSAFPHRLDDVLTSSFEGSFDKCLEIYYTFTNIPDRVRDASSPGFGFVVAFVVISLVPQDLISLDLHAIPHGTHDRGGKERFTCRPEDLTRLRDKLSARGDIHASDIGEGNCQSLNFYIQ